MEDYKCCKCNHSVTSFWWGLGVILKSGKRIVYDCKLRDLEEAEADAISKYGDAIEKMEVADYCPYCLAKQD